MRAQPAFRNVLDSFSARSAAGGRIQPSTSGLRRQADRLRDAVLRDDEAAALTGTEVGNARAKPDQVQ
jgi:hypothetical protein